MNIKFSNSYLKFISSLFIYIIIFSCSSNRKKKLQSIKDSINFQYEFIIKNDEYINQIKQSLPGKFIKLSKGFTYYELANPNTSNPTIVLIHGFSVPSYIWDPTFLKAKELGYKVLRFDLFGRGYSQNPNLDYTDELFANQSWDLIDSLYIDKPILIGLSNGGRVISKMANIYPNKIEKLIYVSSNGFNNVEEKSDKSVSQKEIFEFINNYDLLSKSQKNDFKYPEKFQDWDKKYSELQKHKGFAKALISTLKNHESLDCIHEEISKTEIQIYTIWGEYDKVVDYHSFEGKINKFFPNRREYFLKSAGHLPHMESTEEFNAILFDEILDFTYKN